MGDDGRSLLRGVVASWRSRSIDQRPVRRARWRSRNLLIRVSLSRSLFHWSWRVQRRRSHRLAHQFSVCALTRRCWSHWQLGLVVIRKTYLARRLRSLKVAQMALLGLSRWAQWSKVERWNSEEQSQRLRQRVLFALLLNVTRQKLIRKGCKDMISRRDTRLKRLVWSVFHLRTEQVRFRFRVQQYARLRLKEMGYFALKELWRNGSGKRVATMFYNRLVQTHLLRAWRRRAYVRKVGNGFGHRRLHNAGRAVLRGWLRRSKVVTKGRKFYEQKKLSSSVQSWKDFVIHNHVFLTGLRQRLSTLQRTRVFYRLVMYRHMRSAHRILKRKSKRHYQIGVQARVFRRWSVLMSVLAYRAHWDLAAHCLELWWEVTRKLKYSRQESEFRHKIHRIDRLRHFLWKWCNGTRDAIEKKDHLIHLAANLSSAKLVRRSWKLWKGLAQQLLLTRQFYLYSRTKSTIQVLKLWKQNSDASRVRRQESAVKQTRAVRHRMNLMRKFQNRLLDAWRSFCFMSRVESENQTNRLAEHFHGWSKRCRERMRGRKIEDEVRKTVAKSTKTTIFQGLAHYARRSSQFRRFIREHESSARCRRSMTLWNWYVFSRRRWRPVKACSQTLGNIKSCALVFDAWKTLVRSRRDFAILLGATALRSTLKLGREVLKVWSLRVEVHRRNEAARLHIHKCLALIIVRVGFNAWSSLSHLMAKAQLMGERSKQMRNYQKKMLSWRHWTRIRVLSRSRGIKVLKYRILRRWWLWLQRRIAFHGALEFAHRSSCLRALVRWRFAAERLVSLRESFHVVSSNTIRGTLERRWRQWLTYVNHVRLGHIADYHWAAARCRIILHRWSIWSNGEAEGNQKTLWAVDWWRHNALRNGVNVWKTHASRKCHHHQQKLSAFAHRRRRVLKAVLEAWEQRYTKAIMMDFAIRHSQRVSCFLAIGKWKNWTDDRFYWAEKTEEVEAMSGQRVKRVVFFNWRDEIDVVAKLRRYQLGAWWIKFQCAVDASQKQREHIQVQRAQKLALGRALWTLSDQVLHKKKLRIRRQTARSFRMRTVFWKFTQACEEESRENQLLQVASENRRQLELRKCIEHLRLGAQKGRDARVASLILRTLKNERLSKTIVIGWREQTVRSKLLFQDTHHLLQRIQLRNMAKALRFLREWSVRSKRLRTAASYMPCRKPFNGWLKVILNQIHRRHLCRIANLWGEHRMKKKALRGLHLRVNAPFDQRETYFTLQIQERLQQQLLERAVEEHARMVSTRHVFNRWKLWKKATRIQKLRIFSHWAELSKRWRTKRRATALLYRIYMLPTFRAMCFYAGFRALFRQARARGKLMLRQRLLHLGWRGLEMMWYRRVSIERRIAQTLEEKDGRKLRGGFEIWKHHLGRLIRRRQDMERLLPLQHKLRLMVMIARMTSVFMAWLGSHHKHVRLREAFRDFTRCRLAGAWRRWNFRRIKRRLRKREESSNMRMVEGVFSELRKNVHLSRSYNMLRESTRIRQLNLHFRSITLDFFAHREARRMARLEAEKLHQHRLHTTMKRHHEAWRRVAHQFARANRLRRWSYWQRMKRCWQGLCRYKRTQDMGRAMKAFNLWGQYVNRRREKWGVHHKAMQFRASALCQCMMDGWATFTYERRQRKALLKKVGQLCRKQRKRVRRDHMLAWLEYSRSISRVERLIRPLQRRVVQRRYLNRLSGLVGRRFFVHSLNLYQRNARIRRGLRDWNRYLTWRRVHSALDAVATKKSNQAALTKAWRAMVHLFIRHLSLQSGYVYLQHVHDRVSMSIGMERWKESINSRKSRSREFNRLERYVLAKLCRRCLRAWERWTMTRLGILQKSKQALALHRVHSLRKGMIGLHLARVVSIRKSTIRTAANMGHRARVHRNRKLLRTTLHAWRRVWKFSTHGKSSYRRSHSKRVPTSPFSKHLLINSRASDAEDKAAVRNVLKRINPPPIAQLATDIFLRETWQDQENFRSMAAASPSERAESPSRQNVMSSELARRLLRLEGGSFR